MRWCWYRAETPKISPPYPTLTWFCLGAAPAPASAPAAGQTFTNNNGGGSGQSFTNNNQGSGTPIVNNNSGGTINNSGGTMSNSGKKL